MPFVGFSVADDGYSLHVASKYITYVHDIKRSQSETFTIDSLMSGVNLISEQSYAINGQSKVGFEYHANTTRYSPYYGVFIPSLTLLSTGQVFRIVMEVELGKFFYDIKPPDAGLQKFGVNLRPSASIGISVNVGVPLKVSFIEVDLSRQRKTGEKSPGGSKVERPKPAINGKLLNEKENVNERN